VAAGKPRVMCRWPPPSFIPQCDGAHQLPTGWSAPYQGAGERRPIGPVEVRVWSLGDHSNSLPLDLNLYLFFFFPFTFSRFIIDLCIEYASSSRSLADSYNTCLHSETDSLTFWAFIVRRS
jgi:hypothetical protein